MPQYPEFLLVEHPVQNAIASRPCISQLRSIGIHGYRLHGRRYSLEERQRNVTRDPWELCITKVSQLTIQATLSELQ